MGSCPLSAELVHLVLSHLNDNIFDLRSCRLASQAFSTEASRILYRSIRITLHYEPSYSERRCKVFNEMLQSKPWILNYIHSLRVDLSMEIGPWMGELRLVNYVTMDPDSIDHQEFTKFLLNMTRASGLEELVVIRGRRICCSLRHVGQDIMTALVAVRFMPSLKRLQLIGLEDPPVALVIGHPGLDRITTLSVKRGSLDIEKSEADWKGLGIPTRAALSTSFREAMVDWDSLLRVHSHLSTFNLKETPPFHEVTHIDLSPILPFYEYLQKVQKRMGGRQPLFPHLKTLHYRSFGAPTHPDSLEEPDPRILESAKEMVARECPTIQKLIVDIVIDLSDYPDQYRTRVLLPTTYLPHLREIQFSLVKYHPLNRDTTEWVPEATLWLQALRSHHRIEQITLSWFLTLPWGDTNDEELYESPKWREVEGLLDRLPALSNAKIFLDALVDVDITGDEWDSIASEKCAKGLRTVWKHPRCSVSATVPTSHNSRAQFYSYYEYS